MKKFIILLAATFLFTGAFAATYSVNITNNKFSPGTLVIHINDFVIWRCIAGPHSATSGVNCVGDGYFNSGPMQTGDSFVHKFPKIGYYTYYCIYQCSNGMTGLINVTNPSGIDSARPLLSTLNFYPNPFSESCFISYVLTKTCELEIDVLNICGKKILNINPGMQLAGSYCSQISTSELAAGAYILRIILNGILSKEILIARQ